MAQLSKLLLLAGQGDYPQHKYFGMVRALADVKLKGDCALDAGIEVFRSIRNQGLTAFKGQTHPFAATHAQANI